MLSYQPLEMSLYCNDGYHFIAYSLKYCLGHLLGSSSYFFDKKFISLIIILKSNEFWHLQSNAVNNRRGKKNLVLSGWGDDSLLSEGYINPHYESSYYQSYTEQTRTNLVSDLYALISNSSFHFVFVIHWFSGHTNYLSRKDWMKILLIMIFLKTWFAMWMKHMVRVPYWFFCRWVSQFCSFLVYSTSAFLAIWHIDSVDSPTQGVSEIYNLFDRLAASYRFSGPSADWILPLHSSVAPSDQRKVFLRPPENIRKVTCGR